jgi:hypothetical protein
MQAEGQALDNRAVFSSVFFSMREEVSSPAVTLGAQPRNAAVHGFSDAASSLSGILIFAMNYGPSLLLWAAILFSPGAVPLAPFALALRSDELVEWRRLCQ